MPIKGLPTSMILDLITTTGGGLFLKLDQTAPQTVINGVPNLNLTELAAPVGKTNGYLSTVDGVLYYFAGGNRYKILATLDNPVAATDRYASLWFLFGNVHN